VVVEDAEAAMGEDADADAVAADTKYHHPLLQEQEKAHQHLNQLLLPTPLQVQGMY